MVVKKRARLSQSAFRSRVGGLNDAFVTWALKELESHRDIIPGCLEYIAQAEELVSSYASTQEETQVLTCGSGDCGQLGHGVATESDTVVGVPRVVQALSGKRIVKVACGGLHNVAVGAGGECYTWGCNDQGSLGRSGDEALPGLVPGLSDVVGVSAGDTQSLACCSDGRVFGWGCYKDKEGKEWYFGKRRATSPTLLPLKNIVHVASGSAFDAAIDSGGKLSTFGVGQVGELGREYDDDIQPQVLATETRIVACGAYHLLVATKSKFLQSCGLNNYGQLGTKGDNSTQLVSVAPFSKYPIVQLAAGQHHSLALTADGQAWAWGRADYGQLGDDKLDLSPGAHRSKPTKVSDKEMRQISSGSNHILALTSDDHKVYAWGYGEMLALATNDDKDLTAPKQVSVVPPSSKPASFVKDVSAGGQHSTFLLA